MTMAMQAIPVKPTGPKVLRIGLFRDKKIVTVLTAKRYGWKSTLSHEYAHA